MHPMRRAAPNAGKKNPAADPVRGRIAFIVFNATDKLRGKNAAIAF